MKITKEQVLNALEVLEQEGMACYEVFYWTDDCAEEITVTRGNLMIKGEYPHLYIGGERIGTSSLRELGLYEGIVESLIEKFKFYFLNEDSKEWLRNRYGNTDRPYKELPGTKF